MAQNISFLGASYSNVPAVTLPKTGGGTARFTDVTDTTAAAADVAQGKYFYTSAGVRTEGTSTGGGGTEAGTVTQDQDGYLVLDDDPPTHITVESLSVTQNGTYTAPTGKAYSPVTVNVSGGGGGGNMSDPIRFFDYDGTLVASYSAVPASLPSVPSHTGLTSGTWNYTLAQVTTQFNATGMCDVGANYDTVSGCTEIDVTLDSDHLEPYLCVAVNGTVTVDWGDGSATDTITGTSWTTTKFKKHSYVQAGDYVISIDGPVGFYKSSANEPSVLTHTSGNARRYIYSQCINAIRLSASATIGQYAFHYLRQLKTITIPHGIASIGAYAFQECQSLVSAIIPSSVTAIGNSSFAQCPSIKSFVMPYTTASVGTGILTGASTIMRAVMPYGTTTIAGSMFASCSSLQSATHIPDTVTSIGGSAFYNCYSLQKVIIPANVGSIGVNAFSSCYSALEYHLLPTTPPTLGNTVFNNIQSGTKIYVPAASLSAYQTATNWSTYASYMVGE